MTGTARTRFAVLIAVFLVGALIAAASAQEKQKISWSARPENTKIAYQHTLEIPDVPNHIIRMIEIRRTYPENPPTVGGLKVVEEITRGTADVVGGNGRSSGYASWRYENGDMSFAEWESITQVVIQPDGGRKATFNGTYLMTGGTGKLRGLKGVGRFTGLVELTPDGKVTRNEYSGEGEYSIER